MTLELTVNTGIKCLDGSFPAFSLLHGPCANALLSLPAFEIKRLSAIGSLPPINSFLVAKIWVIIRKKIVTMGL